MPYHYIGKVCIMVLHYVEEDAKYNEYYCCFLHHWYVNKYGFGRHPAGMAVCNEAFDSGVMKQTKCMKKDFAEFLPIPIIIQLKLAGIEFV